MAAVKTEGVKSGRKVAKTLKQEQVDDLTKIREALKYTEEGARLEIDNRQAVVERINTEINNTSNPIERSKLQKALENAEYDLFVMQEYGMLQNKSVKELNNLATDFKEAIKQGKKEFQKHQQEIKKEKDDLIEKTSKDSFLEN